MLKVIHATPIVFGERISSLPCREISEDILKNKTVYCIKNCFHSSDIDRLREEAFTYFMSLTATADDIQSFGYGNPEQLDQSQHSIVHGVSSFQKSLYYYHVYAFGKMENLPLHLAPAVKKLFGSLLHLYNDLTDQDYPLEGVIEGTKRFRPHLVQYPTGGGMFAAHIHPLEPQKIGLILGFSKRGRDFEDCATGFEADDGRMIDTASDHDLGDIVLFRYDMKHWVSPCDIRQALDDTRSNGRWTALFAIS